MLPADATTVSSEKACNVYTKKMAWIQRHLLQAVQGANTWPITTRHLKTNLKTVFKRRMPSGMIIFSMLIMRCSHDHSRGKLIFVGHSPSQELLPNHIKNGAYPFFIPMELWNSCPEYKLFDLTNSESAFTKRSDTKSSSIVVSWNDSKRKENVMITIIHFITRLHNNYKGYSHILLYHDDSKASLA